MATTEAGCWRNIPISLIDPLGGAIPTLWRRVPECSVGGGGVPPECEPTHWLRITVLRTALPEPARSGLHRFLGWCEHDQHDSDDGKRRYVAEQMSVFTRILKCLHCHNRSMDEARPRCESDQAAIR
jgi:hypothetical protein